MQTTTSQDESPYALAAVSSNERPLEPVWILFSVLGALFFVALYATIFFHPTKSAILLFLAAGPVGFRVAAIVAGKIASAFPSRSR